MATISGARDLGINSYTGSITPGKRADMIVIDLAALNLADGGRWRSLTGSSWRPSRRTWIR